MNATRVPITKVRENRSETIISLIAVFLLGATLGSGFILYKNGNLTLPSLNQNAQLGAVALSNIATSTTDDTAERATSTSGAQVTAPTQPVVVAPAQATVPTVSTTQKRELTLLVNDRTIAIERLNQEIERTKNASVAIIASFEQSCGSWNDICATPYASKLNENNASYDELVGTLHKLTAELESLKQELSSLN